MACRLRGFALIASLVVPTGSCLGEDEPQGQERLMMMERELGQYVIEPPADATAEAFEFGAKPLLRYSDLTRGSNESNVLIDATLWRLGTEGRPTSLITLEIYRSSGARGLLALECLSLTDSRFSLRHSEYDNIAWDADECALTMQELPDGPVPAETESARLLQLRRLARRFAVREKIESGESMTCRLLPQPLDRYAADDEQIVDGALFGYANGTNPEVGVFVECGGTTWSYGIVRLSAAEMTVQLDEREVVSFPAVVSINKTRGSYVAHVRPVELAP